MCLAFWICFGPPPVFPPRSAHRDMHIYGSSSCCGLGLRVLFLLLRCCCTLCDFFPIITGMYLSIRYLASPPPPLSPGFMQEGVVSTYIACIYFPGGLHFRRTSFRAFDTLPRETLRPNILHTKNTRIYFYLCTDTTKRHVPTFVFTAREQGTMCAGYVDAFNAQHSHA